MLHGCGSMVLWFGAMVGVAGSEALNPELNSHTHLVRHHPVVRLVGCGVPWCAVVCAGVCRVPGCTLNISLKQSKQSKMCTGIAPAFSNMLLLSGAHKLHGVAWQCVPDWRASSGPLSHPAASWVRPTPCGVNCFFGFETCFGPSTQGAGILCAQDKCPIMNQLLDHDRALVSGVWTSKHISNPDFACKPF